MNSNAEIKEGYALVSVNPKVYGLDVIYSAAYVLIDKAYILLDGDPEKGITVEIKPKNSLYKSEDLVNIFNDQLINYAVYKMQSDRNAEIKKALIQRALLTNGFDPVDPENADK